MSKEQSDLHKFIAEFKKEFDQLPPEQLLFLEVVTTLESMLVIVVSLLKHAYSC